MLGKCFRKPFLHFQKKDKSDDKIIVFRKIGLVKSSFSLPCMLRKTKPEDLCMIVENRLLAQGVWLRETENISIETK